MVAKAWDTSVKSKGPGSSIRSIWFFLPILILALFTAGLFTYPFVSFDPLPLLDLSRESWTACYESGHGPPCRMEAIPVPADVTWLKDRRFKGDISYSVEFHTPRECLWPRESCSLYVAELGDAAQFTLNGRSLPDHGRLPPEGRYARHYPVNLSIPSEFLNPSGLNRLTLSAHSFKNVQAGIRKGPVGIFTSEDAFQLTRIRITQNIVIPLVSATLLFLLALTTGTYLVFTEERSSELKSLIRFCAAMSFFLFSFTELPREFFPVNFAGFLHYSLRFFSDLTFFELMRRVFFPASLRLRKLRGLYWLVLSSYPVVYGVLLLQGAFVERGFGDAYLITRIAVPLLILPHVMGLVGAWKMERSAFRMLLVTVFLLTLGFQINDALVFHAVVQGNYFVKIYPVMLAFALGLHLFRNLTQQMVERALALKGNAVFGAVAAQVAHDIRSPLSALEMISGQLDELSEEKRLIVRNAIARIRDIAHSLKRKGEPSRIPEDETSRESGGRDGPDQIEDLILSPILEELIAEKRLEYRERLDVLIRFDPSREAYGLAAAVDPRELKRVISNLVNNSVESLSGRGGKVDVFLRPASAGGLEITIHDDGCGMSPSLIDRLGVWGVTFNKSGGSGLGLAHAKETIESWGGRVRIESDVGRGTRVTLALPRKDPPSWFVPNLAVRSGATVVIVDDDQSIHQVWQGRFGLESTVQKGVSLEHLSNSEQFRQFYRTRYFDLEDPLFLVDYEILGGPGTSGLDLIEECGITDRAILVTSHYEDPGIRRRCERSGVRLIPKSMSGFVPIKIHPVGDYFSEG
jgi:signal transduction histidine kinase